MDETERELDRRLVANAGIGGPEGRTWEIERDWWRVFEVNVLGVNHAAGGHSAHAGGGGAHRHHRQRGQYPPGASSTAYPASKAAVVRYAETLANELEGRLPVFVFSPGLVQTAMTGWLLRRQRALDSSEPAPQLVRVLHQAGRTRSRGAISTPSTTTSRTRSERADEIRENDLNAIRLQPGSRRYG